MTTRESCRSCGASITWVTMDTGKSMPIDWQPNPLGNVAVRPHGRDQKLHGRVVSGAKPLDESCERLGMSHFATCPNATSHRRRP